MVQEAAVLGAVEISWVESGIEGPHRGLDMADRSHS